MHSYLIFILQRRSRYVTRPTAPVTGLPNLFFPML